MAIVRNGRLMVYPAEVLLNTDILSEEVYRVSEVSCLAQAILGYGINNAQIVSGLNCTVTSPASLGVDIAPGTIYNLEDLDATAYPPSGGLPADTTDMLYKQGINLAKTNVSGLTPPMSGNNYYLIQAQWATLDTQPTTRQYYNPSNPAVPITLTANSVRTDYVSISTKVSTSSIPTPDAGHVGIWSVTVPSGATVVTSGMIAIYNNGAAFISETLTQKLSYKNFQNCSPIFGLDIGTTNALSVTSPYPVYTEIVAGTRVFVKVANNNTGASTLTINGLTTYNIFVSSSSGPVPLIGGELIANCIYEFMFDGSQFQLLTTPTSINLGSVPPGTIIDFGGASIPAGYLLCDGSIVAQATWPALYAAIGSTWNTGGEGGGNFRLPGLARCNKVGSGGSATSPAFTGTTTGNYGGEEVHTITDAETRTHTHGATGLQAVIPTYDTGSGSGEIAGTSSTFKANVTVNITGSTASFGSSTAFNEMPKGAIVTMCIKT